MRLEMVGLGKERQESHGIEQVCHVSRPSSQESLAPEMCDSLTSVR